MGARCGCCDLPIESCGKAVENAIRTQQRDERARVLATPGWIVSGYPGRCARCQAGYGPGTPIARHALGWAAECCYEELAQSPRH